MIEVKNISKKYGIKWAVKNVSGLFADNCTVIQGPSGSGKTTLLRLIAGLEAPDSGEVYFNDLLTNNKKRYIEPHRLNISFVFQTPNLWNHLTVLQNITFGMKKNSISNKSAFANNITQTLEIEHLHDKYPKELSGGEARRVSIARALAPNPKYILMDEPLVNIEARLKKKILKFICKYNEEQKSTMIYVTHDSREAKSISGKVIYMNMGTISELQLVKQQSFAR